MRNIFCAVLVFTSIFFASSSQEARADGFAAIVSPPRFEDTAKSGKVYRNVIDFYNVSNEKGNFKASTADWIFDSKTLDVKFTDKLSESSCRPWVFLESPQISLEAQAKKRYRFEVRIPQETPAQECRFAILFTGNDANENGIVVSGQLAVVVYLKIDGASAKIDLIQSTSMIDNGVKVPALIVENKGNASTRLEGYLDGVDAKGQQITLLPNSYPILPGRTDTLALIPQGINDTAPTPVVSYPIKVKGTIVWDQNKIEIDSTIE